MYHHRYQLGQEASLVWLCTDGQDRPADPDAFPRVAIYDDAGAIVSDGPVPVSSRAATTGLFASRTFLGEDFGLGQYLAVLRYTVSGTSYAQLRRFEIMPGGGPSGAVIAMHSYYRPGTNFLVQQRTSGTLYRGKAPRRTA